jgi:hypothetical protein
MLDEPEDRWDAGTFVLLYPVGNERCATAARAYRQCLTDGRTFEAHTLDALVQAVSLATTDSWPRDVYRRYLDPDLVNTASTASRDPVVRPAHPADPGPRPSGRRGPG